MRASGTYAAVTGGALHPCYRRILALAVVTFLAGCSQKVATKSATISATFDQAGQHPATMAVTGAATVSCSDSSGSQGAPVNCLILAPGYLGEVALHQSVAITSAGMVQLTCSSQGRCSAVVTQ